MTGTRNSNSARRPQSVLQWAGLTGPAFLILALVLLLVLASGLSVVRTTHLNRFSFSELQQLKEQANELEVQWGQLLLEQSTFGVEGRIEQKAVEQLNMALPDVSSIVLVEHGN